PYRVLGYPVIPALFVVGTLLVIGYSLYTDPIATGRSLIITLLGLPLYFVWRFFADRNVPETP
ncbi:MAG: hypothetical protein ACRESC_01010, partial [Gammaproteobacteria bacterium]